MRSCGRKDCCSKKGTMVDATIMSGQGYTKNQKQCGGAKARGSSTTRRRGCCDRIIPRRCATSCACSLANNTWPVYEHLERAYVPGARVRTRYCPKAYERTTRSIRPGRGLQRRNGGQGARSGGYAGFGSRVATDWLAGRGFAGTRMPGTMRRRSRLFGAKVRDSG
jgi:hypothetical protein